MFESLSRTLTCTRELISIYMRYSQGEGLNTSLSRLFYLVLYSVVQLLWKIITLVLNEESLPSRFYRSCNEVKLLQLYCFVLGMRSIKSSPYAK